MAHRSDSGWLFACQWFTYQFISQLQRPFSTLSPGVYFIAMTHPTIQETISRIEERLKSNEGLSTEKRTELLTLVEELKREVADLAKTHREDADSIASFAETSVREATRREKNPELLEMSVDTMLLSARRFEVSHPSLVGLINTIGQTLWKIGI